MARKAKKNYHPDSGVLGEPIVQVKCGSTKTHISLQDLEICLWKLKTVRGGGMRHVRHKINTFLDRAINQDLESLAYG